MRYVRLDADNNVGQATEAIAAIADDLEQAIG